MAPQKHWTVEEEDKAAALLKRGATDEEFMREVGRTRGAAYARFNNCKRLRKYEASHNHKVVNEPGRPTAEMLADAERRNKAYRERSDIAAILGDPPRGESVLDRSSRHAFKSFSRLTGRCRLAGSDEVTIQGSGSGFGETADSDGDDDGSRREAAE